MTQIVSYVKTDISYVEAWLICFSLARRTETALTSKPKKCTKEIAFILSEAMHTLVFFLYFLVITTSIKLEA
jgi:hypothetical protein